MPLIFKKKQPHSTLFIWDIVESEQDFKTLIPLASYSFINENTRLLKRRFEKFSQLCLQKEAGIKSDDLYYQSSGKPFLHSGKHVSFSHSGNYSALLMSDFNCGLDLEFPNEKIIQISSKFISEKENSLLHVKENIYWAWSIKEAVFKYFGERVNFKEHIYIEKIDSLQNLAQVYYCGNHGKGQFEIELTRFKNSYLAFTKRYTSL